MKLAFSLLQEIFWLSIWMTGVGTMAAFILRWLAGDHFLAGRLAGYFMPWLLLILVPGLVAALLAHRKWLALVLGIPMLLVIHAYWPLFWPPPGSRVAPASLKVMSFNVWSQNRKVAEMAGVIRGELPDILLLQEIKTERFAELRSQLAGLYPDGSLHYAYEPRLLQAVISRYPVLPLENLHHRGQAQKVEIETPAGKVTIFNVHPLRSGGWQRRYRQIVSLLEEEVVGEPGAKILAGDFNVNDQTQLYREITRHLRDAHREEGYGFGFSFPSAEAKLIGDLPLPPMIRIDHVFYSPHFKALSARTLANSGGSDHFPVIAELLYREICR